MSEELDYIDNEAMRKYIELGNMGRAPAAFGIRTIQLPNGKELCVEFEVSNSESADIGIEYKHAQYIEWLNIIVTASKCKLYVSIH